MTMSRTNCASSSVSGSRFGNCRSARAGAVSSGGTRISCPASTRSPGTARLPASRSCPVRAHRETMLKLTSGMCRLNHRSSLIPSSSSPTAKVRASAMRGRLRVLGPILKRLALQLLDQLHRLGTFPEPFVTMLLRAPDPPALPRQSIGLADDEHRELRLTALLRFVVHISEHLAQLAHLRPGEMVAEELQ